MDHTSNAAHNLVYPIKPREHRGLIHEVTTTANQYTG